MVPGIGTLPWEVPRGVAADALEGRWWSVVTGERIKRGSKGTLLGRVGQSATLGTDGRAYVLSPFGGMSAFLAVRLGHARCLARSRSHPGSRPIKLRLPSTYPTKIWPLPYPKSSNPSLPMPSGAGFLVFPAPPNQTFQRSAA